MTTRLPVAIVTGSAGGIGFEIASALAANGHSLAMCDRDGERLARTVKRSRLDRPPNVAAQVDVRDFDQVKSFIDDVVGRVGVPAVLVNNAAGLRRGRLEDLTVEDWDDSYATNLRAVALLSNLFARVVMAAGAAGTIVNVASIGGHVAQPGAGAYSATKAGVLALTRQAAVEWGPFSIRCNSVSPGFVDSDRAGASYRKAGVSERRRTAVPVRQLATGRDIADAVLFLVSDAARNVTGHDLVVDGGLTSSLMAQIGFS